MIYGVGARVVIAPTAGAADASGPIEFHAVPVSLMPGPMFEAGVDAFFDAVVGTCARAQDTGALNAVIRQLQDERRDAGIAAWRQLEARLGYDPDAAPDGVIERLSEFEEQIGADAVEEAAVGSPGAEAAAILEQAIEASQASTVQVDLEIAAAAAEPNDRLDLTRPTWMVAEDAAARLRNAVGHPHGRFLNQALEEALGIRWDAVKGAVPTARRLPYGARIRQHGSADRVALQTRSAHDRRFELARVLGDAVWTGRSEFGVISRGKTDRQKFQRAFAQSLLCPFEDLRHYVDLSGPTQIQIETAARRFHVHTSVVRTLLVNKGFLPRETLGERLEAA
jgi:hypothetical protein